MDSSTTPVRRPEIAWRVIDGEAVVVNPRTGLVYPFNPVATRCWELADGSRSMQEMIAALCEEFEAPPEQIEADVRRFVAELNEKGLLMPSADAARDGHGRV